MHLSPTKIRAAVAMAVLLVLALALAPTAGASVYWGDTVGSAPSLPGTTIGRANNDGTGIDPSFIQGASVPGMMVVDGAHVYWINDDASHTIGRANLDGSGVIPRFIDTRMDPSGLAVDGAHIYWTENTATVLDGGAIARANLDGTGVDHNFITGGRLTQGVAVDRAHIYWANSDIHTIGRANLDGSGVDQSFASLGTRGPVQLAVDAAHIYWTDISTGAVGRANIDGTAVNPNFILGGDFTLGLAVDSAHIYWTNQFPSDDGLSGGTIGRANLDGTGVTQTFLSGLADPVGVAADGGAPAAQPSRISISDARTAEGNAGQTALRFDVSLDRGPSAPVTVDYATADGTAIAPSDYAATRGTVTFAAGETAKTVTVPVNGDTTVEPDESFRVNLSNATGHATIADATGTETIINDDQPVITPPPSRTSIGDARMAEGNAGQTAFRFDVSLDRAQSAPVTVGYAIADGTASAPGDYTAGTGTLTFAAGQTAMTVTVQVNGDLRKETDETFDVNLWNTAGNAVIADGRAVGTIVNDDRRRARHTFALGKPRLSPGTGTARLAVTVPGPGRLALSGAGVKAAGAVIARAARVAGTTHVRIRASGAKRRTLARIGEVTVRPRVTYTPADGHPRTRSRDVHLEKR